VGERRRIEGSGDLVAVIRGVLGQGDDVDLLAVKELILLADGVAGVDELLLPPLPVGLGPADHVRDPLEGEAVVEDAAGPERRVRAPDDGERRDRRQARRLRARHEEL
jgi:hypothetical protein